MGQDIATILREAFASSWYLENNSDVREANLNPLEHYVESGWKEGRRPHPLFDSAWYSRQCEQAPDSDPFLDYLTSGWLLGRTPHPLFDGQRYLARNQDVAAAGINPLLHYHVFGRVENRSAHDLFDTTFYLMNNPDVAQAGVDPLVHYVCYGWLEKRDPHPLFSVEYYLNTNPDVAAAGLEPLAHYTVAGWREGRSPHGLFDVRRYLDNYPDVGATGIEPLTHYILYGYEEGRLPHPLFDSTWYIQNNLDVSQSTILPLVHFVTSGAGQLRSPHPLFDPKFYLSQIVDATSVSNPLLHYLMFGARMGLNPNKLFDNDWYLDQHELLRFSDVNPLVHYVSEGWKERRDPHPDFDIQWYLTINDDVADSGIEPLAHFLMSGEREGREPAPPSRSSQKCAVLDIPYEVRYANTHFDGKDVCLLVTYSRDGELSRHLPRHISAYTLAGFNVVLVVVTEGIAHPLPNTIPGVDALIVRINHGWDFAAWATALTVLPDVWRANNVILANDSVYGPVSEEAFAGVISSVVGSVADIVALTDSYQNYRHYMSYFVALKPSALKSDVVRSFWNAIESIKDKDAVIHSYELPALNLFEAAGLTVDILFPTMPGSTANPTLAGWRQLLSKGFPYIKVQALRDDLEQVNKVNWETEIGGNTTLRDDINHHLTKIRASMNRKVEAAPVPAPRRRFKRPNFIQNQIGAVNAVRPAEGTDLVIKIPFEFEVEHATLPSSVAVIAHIYYPELSDEIRAYIERIPGRADVFISTDAVDKQVMIQTAFASYARGSVQVTVFPNVGRDIAPMLVGYREIIEQYEYILHLHSKRSPHSDAYRGWRSYLSDTLIGSEAGIASILSLFQHSDVGIVFADHFAPIRHLLNWGYNFDVCKELLGRMGVALDQGLVLEFPSSSFFWARSAALKPLLQLELRWSDFHQEGGQIDGTVAHAIERCLLYAAESAGFSWTKVGTVGNVPITRLVPVFDFNEIPPAIFRTHRPLLGNAVRPYNYYGLVSEERSAGVRLDPSPRPRLNLVIPTLRPEMVFGGISTAIKTFNEIAENFSSSVDMRILVMSTPVNMDSTYAFPDFRVLQPGSPYGSFKNIIVDVCDKASQFEIPVRTNDVFVTTAWWTHSYAQTFIDFQRRRFGRAPKSVYLVQDFESGFYPWSNQYCLSEETYKTLDNAIALVNSEELSLFLQSKYKFKDARVIRYKANEKIRDSLRELPRERVIVFYGRPTTPRNCFESICKGIVLWQQTNPVLAAKWAIVSVGESYVRRLAGPVRNLEIKGKLSLEEYGELLSRASVGVSLMVSPHPSYPPLEMALAGVRVITNNYDIKNLESRSAYITAIDAISPTAIADALTTCVGLAEEVIGTSTSGSVISDIECNLVDYTPLEVAKALELSFI